MASPDPAGSSDQGGSTSCITARGLRMQQIDALIQQQMDEVLAYKAERNKCAPISSLTTEIMTNIFIMVKQLYDDVISHAQSVSLRRTGLHWIRVSHVCTAWRKIALDAIVLWTDPPFWNISWAEETIRRSKGAPLTIRDNFEATDIKAQQLFLETIRRGDDIKALHLSSTSHDILNNLPTHLPRLTKVHLTGDTAPILMAISEAITLTELELDSCICDWVLHLPPSITSLGLKYVRTASTSTFAQFLDALHRLPLLQYLGLAWSMDTFQIPNHPIAPVKLPRLEYLHIVSTMEDAAMFFCNTIIPPNIRLLFLETNEAIDNPNDQNFAINTRNMLAGISRIYSDQSCNISFRTLSSVGVENIAFKFQSGDGHTLHLSIALSNQRIPLDRFTEILTTIFSSGLPMNDIETVELVSYSGVMPQFTPHDLAQSLGRLPNVSRVVASEQQAWQLLEAIQMRVNEEELYFDNLSALHLSRLDLSTENKLFDKLQDCLKFRYEYGAEITNLMLEDCWQLDGYMISELQQIVPDVDWDHFEHGFASGSPYDGTADMPDHGLNMDLSNFLASL